MIGTNDTGRRWSIGELARASGLTVRALRHYDEIGLLRASERTASGHRRYTEPGLRRLYRVRALRALGLSLKEIAGVLAGTADDLGTMRGLLAGQLHRLEEHEQQIQRLKEQIHELLRQIDGSSMPDPDQFMTTLEMISVVAGQQRRTQPAAAVARGPDDGSGRLPGPSSAEPPRDRRS
ncbi:MAG TPA: MerR family transcriptional regulator [Actinomadura sp.]|nr:MerR family transcriptional regulator [Actinomadura sp.]